MGRDRGAASSQAILAESVPDVRRTWALAWYNLVLDAGHTSGALAAMIPTILMRATVLESRPAHELTLVM